jgi:hypothetical protein
MPRYAILRHDDPRGLHYDVLFEQDGVLQTWSIPFPPDERANQPAKSLPDHRIDYLNYEGPVSGDRGHVSRWDEGDYEGIEEDAALSVMRLMGKRLQGDIEWRQNDAGAWKMTYKKVRVANDE